MNPEPNKQQTTDLRRLSHDMRNMLSSIYSYAQLLELSLKEPGSENDLEIVHAIEEAVKKMGELIAQELDGQDSIA